MKNNTARNWLASLLAVSLLCSVFFVARADGPAQTLQPHSQLPVQLNSSRPDAALVAVPGPDARALSHYRSSLVLLGVLILWNLFIPALFLFTGLSARMRSWAARWGRKWYFTFVLYCIAFGLVYYLVSLGYHTEDPRRGRTALYPGA